MNSKMRDFWSGMPAGIRGGIIAVLAATASALGAWQVKPQVAAPAQEQTYWDEKDLRKIFREEIGTLKADVSELKAGFRASLSKQSAKDQLAILNAMEMAREQAREAHRRQRDN